MLRLSDLPAGVRERIAERQNAKGKKQSGRARGGRRANVAGEGLEDRVAAAAACQRNVLELDGLPRCGARYIGPGKVIAQEVDCDFHGTIVGPGTAIYFDAKRVGDDVGGLRIGDKKIVKRHQRVFLHRHAMAGAIAGILTEHAGIYRWLDGRHLVCLEGKVRSVKWEDPRWHVLGTSIDFGKLLAAYARTPNDERGTMKGGGDEP